MGLNDRDYFQSDFSYDDDYNKPKRRQRRGGGRSVVVVFIVINIVLWLANGLFFTGNALTESLVLRQDLSSQVVEEQTRFFDIASSYQFLTHGFAHSSMNPWHIIFNMLLLMMFGYGMMLAIGSGAGVSGFGFVRGENVESQLGRMEFAAFYLLTIIISGIVFALTNFNTPQVGVLGASGAVTGVVILYAWLYPRKTLLLYGILPMPMWAIGVIFVLFDVVGATQRPECGIAFSVHLAGAACGTLYYFLLLKQGRKLTDWFDISIKVEVETDQTPPKSKPSEPKMRIHVPEDCLPPKVSLPEDEFNLQLDQVLKRYGEVGEAGLTASEREFLRRASQRFAEKKGKE